jgi:hypothetical protein
MDNISSKQHTPNPPVSFATMCTDPSTMDAGTLFLEEAGLHTTFPSLCRPDDSIADPGILRIGDAEISPQLPCL